MALLLLLTLMTASHIISAESDCVYIKDVCYEREILKTNIEVFQLSIDFHKKYLFFSQYVSSNNAEKAGYIDLNENSDREVHRIPGIENGYATAFDPKNNVTYISYDDGLYKYDAANNISTQVIHIDNRYSKLGCLQMYYKDKLYCANSIYTTYFALALVLENDTFVNVPELHHIQVSSIAFDKSNNMYYGNSTGIYKYVKEESETKTIYYHPQCQTRLEFGLFTRWCNPNLHRSYQSFHVHGFASDAGYNTIYLYDFENIYYINDNDRVRSILDYRKHHHIRGLAIDIDNSIIYSTTDTIYRLKPTKN